MADVIVAEALSKSYGRRRGVIDLTFSVKPGEVFGYLGPNGAGKTTTIRTLLDFIRPTGGQASIFGLDIRADSAEIHRRIGYLPGERTLYERLTGAEFLSYFAALRGGVDWGYVEDLAARFACDLTVRIRSLSHGNKQKVALIQAVMHRPELMILDEPTQGLDPLVQQEFYTLAEEVRAEGRTIFLSSHVMAEVERLCDRAAIIREGRLIAVEDIGDLKARATRRIEFHFARPVDPTALSGVRGVRDVEAHGDTLRVTVAGPLDAIVKAVSQFEVIDLASHEPSLEDVFLTFYGKGESDAD